MYVVRARGLSAALGASLLLRELKMSLLKRVCLLILILPVISAPCVKAFALVPDVFWLDRYGDISWEDEKIRLDNFAAHLTIEQKFYGYIVVRAGRRACRGEAQAHAVRAKKYLMEVRGIAWDRVAWKDIGYGDDKEVKLFLFERGKPVPYEFKYEPPKEEHMIKDCKLGAQRRTRRGKS
jgi:hypothetical protein